MGVRGLTSYIAKNAEKYLEPYELHDCDLVIDGDSLASNLYSWHSNCNSAFGGDYDQYYRCVVTFFTMLKQCNVTPYVLLDGGYERKKLQTVRTRLRSKIGAVKHINPFRCIPLFPLMLREVFVEAVKTTGCRLMRCLFEADDEVSVLARKLNCPVLSYDSDFYIHNVMYIPSITLSFRVHKRKAPKKNRAKSTIDGDTPVGYHYMDCCVYSIKNLVRNELANGMLPLFATLLGNDYINGGLFRKFYANVSLKHIGKKNSQQQRRIIGLLRWLQHETVDSAIAKVLSRFEKDRRPWMLCQIVAAMGGYNREDSRAAEFFELDQVTGELTEDYCARLTDENIDSYEICEDEESDHTSEEDISSGDEDCEETGSDVKEEEDFCNKSEEENQQFQIDYEEAETNESFEPPGWILEKILAAELPRFVVDLLHLKLYVNSPQIENFMLNDSNEIALPILQLIFTLLHYPKPCQFQYLTRVLRISNVHYKKIESIPLGSQFDPTVSKNIQIFEQIFKEFDNKINVVMNLPENLRLFVLAMTYLSEKNTQITSPYLHSLLIAFLLLSKADEDVQPVNRDPHILQKKYGLDVANGTRECKQVSDKQVEVLNDTTPVDCTSIIQSITTNDSVLFLRNVLPLFQISDKIREKHTDFSSTIVHTFAEFQAIIFNLNCLNTLLNEPFQRIVVSKVLNGTFLYNMYVNLRDRPNIEHYIRHYVFKDCERYYGLYMNILNVCKSVISCLKDDKEKKFKASRNYRRNRRKQKLKTVIQKDAEIAENAYVDVDPDDGIGDGEVEFDDLNNKFAKLLNCSKTL